MTTQLVLLLFIAALSPSAHASIDVTKTTESHATSEGVGMRFVEMKKTIIVPQMPDLVYSATDTRFVYTVPSVAQIENYAVVQFLRGCQWESRLVDGKVVNTFGISRDYFPGKDAFIFRHPHWQIDNDNDDPVYTTSEGAGRFALLRWNDDPNSLDANDAHYYQTKKPLVPLVFATDLPSYASFDPAFNFAHNTTLEFRTCLFKVSDLPAHTTPDGAGVDQSKALWCATWDHKYVWNFTTKHMDTPTAIDPFCATQP